jgi:lipoprotein-releasing system permease protein
MFKLLLIWRYFVRRHIALVAVAAVGIVVTLVLVVLSVMSGLLNEARDNNHHWAGDVVITRDSLAGFGYYDEFISRLNAGGPVETATPVIKTYAMVHDRIRQIFGVRLESFCRVTGFARTLDWSFAKHDLSFILPENAYMLQGGKPLSPHQRRRGLIEGTLGRNRNDFPDALSWPITVFALDSRGMLTGAESGEHQTFWTLGSSKTPLVDIVGSLYVDFDELQKLCLMDGSADGVKRTHEIRIKLKPGVDLAAGRAAVAEAWASFVRAYRDQPAGNLLGDVKVQTWKEFRRARIAPAEKEKTMLILVFAMLSFVCIFIIFTVFYLIVTEKIKDLGVIKSVGGSSLAAGGIFLGYGLLVGLVGAAVGTTLGWAVVTHANQIEAVLNRHFGFRLWNPDVYTIDRIPDVVDAAQAGVIALSAVLVSVIGATLPAIRAGRLAAVDALRVE